MPSTTDRPDGSDDPFAIAEAALVAARETVPVARTPQSDRITPDPDDDRPTEALDRTTEAVSVRRPATDDLEATGRIDPPTGRIDPPTAGIDPPTAGIDPPTAGRSQPPTAGRSGPPTANRSGPRTAGRSDEATADLQRDTVVVDDKMLGGRETVKLPERRRPPRRTSRAPLPVAAAFATLWAALLSYLPVAAVIGLARTLEGAGGLGGAAHAGAAGWLLGHGVPIGTSIGSLGLAPLLLTLLILWRLNRAGLHVTRAIGARRSGSIGGALGVAFAIALSYSLLGSVTALLVDGRGTEVSAGRAALNFFLLGLGGALAGSLRGTDALSVLARRVPPPVRHGIRAGVVAALLILAAGAAATGLSVAVGGGQAADMISAYRTGVAGQAGITLLSLAYGMNAVVWAAAYLLGPGFAIGTGSSIGLTEVTVGPLPTVPLLAGLPAGPMGAAGAALLAVPVLAGLGAGWLLTLRLIAGRRVPAKAQPGEKAEPSWALVLGSSLVAGPAAGLVLGLLSRFSGGSLGDGRMATIGPDPWQVALVATIMIAISASIGAAAARTFGAGRKG